MIREGDVSDRLYFIKEGQVCLYKMVPNIDLTGFKSKREYKLMTLDVGQVFGEDKFIFRCANRYTAKVTSVNAHILTVRTAEFQQYYKKVVPVFTELMRHRKELMNKQLGSVQKNMVLTGLTTLE